MLPAVVFRKDNVDLEPTFDAGKGFDVGWTTPGEWLSYGVTVYDSATYRFTARVASGTSGTKSFHIEVDGANVSGQIVFTTNQGWQTFSDISFNLPLSNTTQRFRLVVDQGGFNLNYLKIENANLYTPISSIPFADAAFGDCVRNLAAANGWTLVKDVISVQCQGLSISKLDGIEYLTNLSQLAMGYNKLTSVDLSKNVKITFVTLEHNKTISFIDVSKCPLLTTLDLWENNLKDINLSGNPVLSWLSVGGNPLTAEAQAYIRSLHIQQLQM